MEPGLAARLDAVVAAARHTASTRAWIVQRHPELADEFDAMLRTTLAEVQRLITPSE